MSTTKQCLACIRTCHRIAREGEGYVATSMRYGLDLTALQMGGSPPRDPDED